MTHNAKQLIGGFAGMNTHPRRPAYFSHAFEVTGQLPPKRRASGPLFFAFATLNRELVVSLHYEGGRRGAIRFVSELQIWAKNPDVSAFDRQFNHDLGNYGLTPETYLEIVFHLVSRIYRESRQAQHTPQATRS